MEQTRLDIAEAKKAKIRITCRYNAVNVTFSDNKGNEIQARISNEQRKELIERLQKRDYYFGGSKKWK